MTREAVQGSRDLAAFVRSPRGCIAAALIGIVVVVAAVILTRRNSTATERGGQEFARAYGMRGLPLTAWRAPLSGYVVSAWLAPNISPDSVSGIGVWSRADIFRYLRQGRAPGRGQAAGPMAPIIRALSDRSDAELYALVDWLARQPAHRDRSDRVAATARGERLAQDPAVLRSASRARGPDAAPTGASLYNGACASCHGADGAARRMAISRRCSTTPLSVAANRTTSLAVLLFGVDRHVGSHGHDAELRWEAGRVRRPLGRPARRAREFRHAAVRRPGSRHDHDAGHTNGTLWVRGSWANDSGDAAS